jgi:hypothetical protein
MSIQETLYPACTYVGNLLIKGASPTTSDFYNYNASDVVD